MICTTTAVHAFLQNYEELSDSIIAILAIVLSVNY